MSEVQRPVATRRFGRVLIALAVLIHVAMLAVVAWRTGTLDGFAFRSVDATEYYALGENLLDQGVFSAGQDRAATPDFWRTPGYPVVLAGLMALAGKSALALVVAQQVFSIVNVWLMWSIARSQMSDRRALVVAMLYLIAPYRLFYTTWLLATTVYSTSLLWLWWLWERWRVTQTLSRAIAVGLLAGVCVLIRPVAILIPFALVAGCWVMESWRCRRAHEPSSVIPRSSVRSAAVLFLACLGVVSVWVVRNRVVGGHWALSSQGGVVLAYFKATEVELWLDGRSGQRYRETSLDPNRLDEPHTVWDDIDQRLQASIQDVPDRARQTLTWRHLAQGNRSQYDPFVVSSALARIGWSMLFDRPFATVAFCLGRSMEALAFPLQLAFEPGLTVGQRLRYAIVGAVYALLALGAVFRLVRSHVSGHPIFFPLACIVCLLLATAPQLDPRFRVPMLPFLLVIAFLPQRDGCTCAKSEPGTR